METRKKILVVDDEEGLRELLVASLKVRGFQMISAGDGEEGLRLALSEAPDMILLDVMMPKMDGWQMLHQLRLNEKTKDTPVAMLTARGEDHQLAIASDYKASEYFLKPVNLDELLSFIRRYFG